MTSSANEKKPACVTISALDAGHLTLPEYLFVTDAEPGRRATVPSLAFLIQHPTSPPGRPGSKTTNIVFDLGIKRDLSSYAPSQEAHIAGRQPIITEPDCAASLRKGNLEPTTDVDMVMLSHVHWDHIGTPGDFPASVFVVGSGTLDMLRNGAGPLYPASIFNDDEVPASRTVELPPVLRPNGDGEYTEPPHTPPNPQARDLLPAAAADWAWKPLAAFPAAIDLYGDGSIHVIDAPGHLYGHVNLLARIGEKRYVYLGGDCCHDPRILRGEKGIAIYDDGKGGTRSVHVHTDEARQTLNRISEFVKLMGGDAEVEVVLAHDREWRERNEHRFWPRSL